MHICKAILAGSMVLGMGVDASAALIAHYQLDETSGSVAADSSGMGNDAVVSGTVDLSVGGVSGTGAGFANATGESVEAPELFSGNDARSVSLWFDANSVLTQGRLFGSGNAGAGQQFDLTLESSTGGVSVGLRYGNGNMFWSGGGIDITSGFHHVVMSYDGSTLMADSAIKIYIDGVLATRDGGNNGNSGQVLQTGSGTALSDSFLVGLDVSGSRRFDGVIDDVQVYDHVLEDGDVAFLNANPGSAIPEPASMALIGLASVLFLGRRK